MILSIKTDLMDCISYFRQRDSTEGDQCSQGELEQHGGTSAGGAGGLQGKKLRLIILKKQVFFTCNIVIYFLYILCFLGRFIYHRHADLLKTGMFVKSLIRRI